MLDAYRTPDRLLARIALHERFGSKSFNLHKWLFDLLLSRDENPVKPGARVLEVGAGTGRMWEVNAGRVPRGWTLTLTDTSSGMLAALEELLGAGALKGRNARVLRADALDLPFRNGEFDVLFANHMLYHVSDPERAVAEFRRVLAPGGLLVASTNGEEHMRQVAEIARPLAGLEGVNLSGIERLSFTCESGVPLLKREFEQVELNRHDDTLEVTERGALLDYLRSLVHVSEEAPEATLAAIREWEEQALATPLPYSVDRATGVFFAH